ncbi:MAG: FtsH protease activity modulator HflK [Clostridiales bacterium]|nr:MAG: FtsH protease activity modulator HflK [Clostridiales bacterium]
MKKIKVGIWIFIFCAFMLLAGVYKLEDGEEAVITRFGEYYKTEVGGGLKWRIPYIDAKYIINTSKVRRMEFGYKTLDENKLESVDSYKDIVTDSLMITGDENLVNVKASIQYKIIDTKKYLFNVDDPIGTLSVVSVSTIRRSVANNKLDDVLADNKNAIMQEIQTDLQKICDDYGLGILITQVLLQDVDPPKEVDNAFKDIVRAQLDKESRINEARSYENKVIPKAKGEASKLLSEARAYKQSRINIAKGDVASFVQLYDKYKNSVDITRSRLYLETMEEVLKDVDIVVSKENGNMLKLLPLNSKNSSLPIDTSKSEKKED